MRKQKSTSFSFLALTLALFLFAGCGNGGDKGAESADEPADVPVETDAARNALSETEKAEGWRLLFDGNSTSGWHGFNGNETVGWTVEDGVLTNPGQGAVDIVSNDQFASFELSFEWKVPANGNSGLMFHVVESEDHAHPWETGPEYQLLDDFSAELKETLKPNQFAAANYDMEAPSRSVSKPTGEWNQSRLVVNGSRVEHWLNGVKVVEYELGSAAWQEQVANSKWKEHPGYGKAETGHIAFQGDHTRVWLRNLKIREL